MDLRARLNRRLADAMQLAATMKAATADIVVEQRKVNARVIAINERLYLGAVNEIARGAETEYFEAVKYADEIRQRLASVSGAIEYLRTVAQQHEARRQMNHMTFVYQAIERLNGLSRLDVTPTRQGAFEKQAEWARALTELLR